MSLERLQDLEQIIYNAKIKKAELETQIKTLGKVRAEAEQEVIHILEENHLHTFDGSLLKMTPSVSLGWRVPQTQEDKAAFFDYLKQRGVFMDLVSVNSQTLNSFVKAERTLSGGGDDFTLPGLSEPTETVRLHLTSRKK